MEIMIGYFVWNIKIGLYVLMNGLKGKDNMDGYCRS